MSNKIAVYVGAFDPVTNGHIDIIERASTMFDKLYVTIALNPNKQCLFNEEERLQLLKEATEKFDNVVVDATDLLSVTYAKEVNASVLVRGLRATMDFEYELQLAYANQYLDHDIDMIFLMTRPSHAFISSSTVKEIASHGHSVKDLVPECVSKALIKKY